MARKKTKKELFKIFTQYGIHIWAILIIANAVMVYTYHFATHAADNNTTAPKYLNASQAPSPSFGASQSPTSNPSPSQDNTNIDPKLNITFTVPGIGSGGGVMKPIHLVRHVTVFLYSPDVNSLNPAVKPLFTVQGTATFDSDPASPTYTSFINPSFDLGSNIIDGDYQIAFRTDQSLRALIKQNPTDIGGQVIGIGKNAPPVPLPSQSMLMGDVVPDQGDNIINVNDYNAFINCYGVRNTTAFCLGHNFGDFNDDGVIDGIDYNILLRSLNTLVQEGIGIPEISPTPTNGRISRLLGTPTPAPKKVKPKATPVPVAATSGGGPGLGIFVFVILFIFLVIGSAVVLYFKNDMIHDAISALIHLSPTGTPSAGVTELAHDVGKLPDKPNADDKPKPKDKPADKPKTETSTDKPKEATPPAADKSDKPKAGGVVEKDCYIKTKGNDDAGTGMWLLLTDDNGSVKAHYAKTGLKDGFAKVKGVMKTENGNTYMEITELSAED